MRHTHLMHFPNHYFFFVECAHTSYSASHACNKVRSSTKRNGCILDSKFPTREKSTHFCPVSQLIPDFLHAEYKGTALQYSIHSNIWNPIHSIDYNQRFMSHKKLCHRQANVKPSTSMFHYQFSNLPIDFIKSNMTDIVGNMISFTGIRHIDKLGNKHTVLKMQLHVARYSTIHPKTLLIKDFHT